MPNIENQQQQEVFDILHAVWNGDQSVDEAYDDILDYLDPEVLNAPRECQACLNESTPGELIIGLPHTCRD